MRSRMPTSLEPLLAEFDKAWRSGLAPKLEDFVQRVPAAERLALLEELIPIDFEYRWRTYSGAGAQATAQLRPGAGLVIAGANSAGIPSHPTLEHYQRHFPELGSSDNYSAELIAAEYFARKRWGDRPGMQEYFLRFPGREAELEKVLGDVDAELARECGAAARSNGAARQGALTQMRSPRCRRRIDRPDASGSDVTCPACGDRCDAAGGSIITCRYRVDKAHAGSVPWKAWDTELQEVAVAAPQWPLRQWRGGRAFPARPRAAFAMRGIPIFDAGQHNQTLFIVADLVRRQESRGMDRRGRLSVRESAELVAQVAEALDMPTAAGSFIAT